MPDQLEILAMHLCFSNLTFQFLAKQFLRLVDQLLEAFIDYFLEMQFTSPIFHTIIAFPF